MTQTPTTEPVLDPGWIPREMSEKDLERFWSKVDRSGGPDACWLWRGRKSAGGYGSFELWERRMRSHHVALATDDRFVPKGGKALHTCHRPPCCNPRHIYIACAGGSGSGSSSIRRERGRSRVLLNQFDVREIRQRARDGESVTHIANSFKVNKELVVRIVNRQMWRHLNDGSEV